MFGLTGEQTAQLEQYKMAMRIINTWDMARTPVIIAAIACLLLSVFLFARKKGGRFFSLILAIILGLTTIGMDQFKTYVQERKQTAVKEAVKEAITSMPKKIVELPENVGKGTTGLLKKILPFGGK